MQRRRVLSLLALGLGAGPIAACGDSSRLPSLPDKLRARAPFKGLPEDTRIVLDGRDEDVLAEIARNALVREISFLQSQGRSQLGTANYLAISGGGENGAFGAGLLTAWSALGTRPEFKVVTGISTGALIAPSAFLGPAYDKDLEFFYTKTSAEDVMTSRGLLTGLLSDSLYDSRPLLRTIRKFLTPALLAAIAYEYNTKGRLLFVATTNLDAPVGVMWNMGAIAASSHPRAAELFARILLASASIPGVFPPVMIDIEVGNERFEEMHVDGGTVAQVVLYPPSFGGADTSRVLADADRKVIEALIKRPRRLFVIRNSRPGTELATIDRSTLKIVERALATLINTQGIGDLYQLYLLSLRDKMDFNLAYIPQSFTDRLEQPFEKAYMAKLYEVGRQEMMTGRAWHKAPPGYDSTPIHLPTG
jgi:predicted acylesterase/phospholipase RssA